MVRNCDSIASHFVEIRMWFSSAVYIHALFVLPNLVVKIAMYLTYIGCESHDYHPSSLFVLDFWGFTYLSSFSQVQRLISVLSIWWSDNAAKHIQLQ